MKTVFAFLITLLLGATALLSGAGCANIVPPQGGPRDSLPPVLLSATPADSTLNFKGNRITLQFDEYVDLQEVQNNLLFTPTVAIIPDVQVRLKTITIRLRDTLDLNTTYIVNFGNAIRDYNEGNVLRDFSYTFSTGPALDSLELTGKVVMAETGMTDTTLTVILHKSLEDSAVVKDRPRYITRLDGSGNFRFKSLPAGTFAVYALGEAGIQRRYESNQAFAFADSAVVISAATPPVTLYAYKAAPATNLANNVTPARNNKDNTVASRLKFSTNLENGTNQDLLKKLVLTFEVPLSTFDSSGLILTTDSTFQPVPYTVLLYSAKKNLTLTTNWLEGTQYNLITAREFATDTLGQQLLKSDTLQFTTRSSSDYGRISIRLKNLDSLQNPVLQFIQNGVVMSSVPVSLGVYNQPLFLPGDYELRLLLDRNKNGVWDAGNFFGQRRQPKLVKPIERRITVKSNWDNEFEISL